MVSPLPSLERLNELFVCDPYAGLLTWKINKSGWAKEGDSAGTIKRDGSFSVMIDRRRYAVHRIIWKFANGTDPIGVIDHIDGNPSNNKIENLREASLSQNASNTILMKRNTSGFKGVSFYKRTGKYQAQIVTKGKLTHLGYFDTAESASIEVEKKRIELHGDFACSGKRAA